MLLQRCSDYTRTLYSETLPLFYGVVVFKFKLSRKFKALDAKCIEAWFRMQKSLSYWSQKFNLKMFSKSACHALCICQILINHEKKFFFEKCCKHDINMKKNFGSKKSTRFHPILDRKLIIIAIKWVFSNDKLLEFCKKAWLQGPPFLCVFFELAILGTYKAATILYLVQIDHN